jgi:hypothetical protein
MVFVGGFGFNSRQPGVWRLILQLTGGLSKLRVNQKGGYYENTVYPKVRSGPCGRSFPVIL